MDNELKRILEEEEARQELPASMQGDYDAVRAQVDEIRERKKQERIAENSKSLWGDLSEVTLQIEREGPTVLSEQEEALLRACVDYSEKPYFLPGHALMLLVAKQFKQLLECRREKRELYRRLREEQTKNFTLSRDRAELMLQLSNKTKLLAKFQTPSPEKIREFITAASSLIENLKKEVPA